MENTNIKQYSFWKGIRKTALQVVAFGIPMLVMAVPDAWKAVTVGSLLSLLANYLKTKITAAYDL